MRLLAPGTRIDRYELIAPIGEGGMAEVWVARREGKHGFEKLFAIKCIHPQLAEEPHFRGMFLREAEIASAIEHPNVAQIFDLGEAQSMLYIVLEYVDGESVASLMTAAFKRTKSAMVSPPLAVRLVADACTGLHAAHGLTDEHGRPRGIVHRDVSPQNILVSTKGDVKLIDFGIAHVAGNLDGRTKEGALKGKLHYMAPEQILHEEIGPATDVFGAGATLYRMLTGKTPFNGGNEASTIQRIITGQAPHPLPESIPPAIRAVVLRALSRDPRARYDTALALRSALEAAAPNGPTQSDIATWAKDNASEGRRNLREALAKRSRGVVAFAEVNEGASAGNNSASPLPSPEVVHKQVPSFDAELGPTPGRSSSAIGSTTASFGEDPGFELGSMHGWAPSAVPAIASLRVDDGIELESIPSGAHSSAASTVDPAGPPSLAPEVPQAPEAPPPPLTERSGPGLMDVRALVARARATGAEPAIPAQGLAAAASRAVRAVDPTIPEAPAQREAVRSETARTERRPTRRSLRWIWVAAPVGTIALAVVALVTLFPLLVRERLIAAASDIGLLLTIDHVSIDFRGLTLSGVAASARGLKGTEFRASELLVTGISARKIRMRGPSLTLEGEPSEVIPALLHIYDAGRERFPSTTPRSISVVSADVRWRSAFGRASEIRANRIDATIEFRGAAADEIHANLASVDVVDPRITLGPWSATIDTTQSTSRIRLLLRPSETEGPSILFVGRSAPHLSVKIPRSPISSLGLRPADFGVAGDTDPEIEVQLEGGLSPTMRMEGAGRFDAYDVRLPNMKSSVDVRVEGSASAERGRPLEFEQTTATVGPFSAHVTGTLTLTDFGFRLDAAWRTVPISCDKLARQALAIFGPMPTPLQKAWQTNRVLRVTGQANVSGTLKYDTHAPSEAAATVVPHESCGLSLFGM